MCTVGSVNISTPKMSINSMPTIVGVASCLIDWVCCGINPFSKYCLPFWAIHWLSISQVIKLRVNRVATELQQSFNRASTERQQIVNDFHYCLCYNPCYILPHLPIIYVLPASMGNMGRVDVATPSMNINRASTILGVASGIIDGVYCGIYPLSNYCQSL